MHKKIAVLRTNKSANNFKEVFYVVWDSVYDVKNKNENLATMRDLMELEKLVDPANQYSYELKLIDEEELEVYFLNCKLNNKVAPYYGSFFGFLVHYARYLDEKINNRQSEIAQSNNNHRSIRSWVYRTSKSLKNNRKQ